LTDLVRAAILGAVTRGKGGGTSNLARQQWVIDSPVPCPDDEHRFGAEVPMAWRSKRKAAARIERTSATCSRCESVRVTLVGPPRRFEVDDGIDLLPSELRLAVRGITVERGGV
jgi:hypothetical protein